MDVAEKNNNGDLSSRIRVDKRTVDMTVGGSIERELSFEAEQGLGGTLYRCYCPFKTHPFFIEHNFDTCLMLSRVEVPLRH